MLFTESQKDTLFFIKIYTFIYPTNVRNPSQLSAKIKEKYCISEVHHQIPLQVWHRQTIVSNRQDQLLSWQSESPP